MPESESRSLHLHTLDSLIADLISGRSVETAAGELFVLPDERTRSALEWYRKKGAAAWTANVSAANGEDLVNAILLAPLTLAALPARPVNTKKRFLKLKKLEAHRFAGLHKFGTPDVPPANYVHEFTSPLTLFEGSNGSGKTSLLNAIIWALTGEMLRPQREPETAGDFECWVTASDGSDERTVHKLSPLTPMPNVEQYRPDQACVLADTWVELTFIDGTCTELPIIRRSLSRSSQGKLKETQTDLSVLGIDPIAIRIGTIMPGLLPLIKIGSESELGRAVSQLTGLSALVDLAEHARRVKAKIDKEFIKAKIAERERADRDYSTVKDDLEKILLTHPSLRPEKTVPQPSDDKGIEKDLDAITKHFEIAKTNAFKSARDILSERFDPENLALLSDLEKNIGGALERVSQPQLLNSAARINALRKLKPEQLNAAETKIKDIIAKAKALDDLAKDPSTAARARLYARVAAWIVDHPDPQRKEDICLVCGGSLEHVIDPVTGRPVITHIHEAASNAVLLSQTLSQWAKNAQGDLMRSLSEPLLTETATDLPPHPCDLLRAAIVDELFAFDPFRGVLGDLKALTAVAFDDVVKECSALTDPTEIRLPKGCDELGEILKRLDCANRFARWRQANEMLVHDIITRVLGSKPKQDEPSEKITLTGKLLDLEATVKNAQPISDALIQCGRLKEHLKTRRKAEQRLSQYTTASLALANLADLGQLVDQQFEQLRKILRKDAAEWRTRIYLGAFPDTAQELVDTGIGRKGELELVVQTGGILAPAQHVTNASALRASLVAFFLAFWEYVLRERGGLTTLVLDDPQELLDDENRERLAASFAALVAANAQLIVTSYDPRFCGCVSRLQLPNGRTEHFAVDPATRQQPVIRTTPPLPVLERRKIQFEADRNAEEPARDFADGCRVFFEAKLGDIFDDPAHAAWAIATPNPTLADFLQRLRQEVKAGPRGMFSAHVFRRFVDHPALANGSPVLMLMNKAHHGRRQEIRAAEVSLCANDLYELLELVEKMYGECYRWRRRDTPKDQSVTDAIPSLEPMTHLTLDVVICPDLAAFTQYAPSGESQELPDRLDPDLLENTVVYYLHRPNFGFAAPEGALAIVESIPGPVTDRGLVIARHGSAVYARRLVRDANYGMIGLTAEVPDPRTRTPKTIFFPETDVAIHQVVGIIFDHFLTVPPGQDEAVRVDVGNVLQRVEVAYRVRDNSAVPLALTKQVVLGSSRIELSELCLYKNTLVALNLDDGSGIFKRVGAALSGEISHLMQFESIGGLGSSQILSVGKPHKGYQSVKSARTIIGVLYLG